MADTGLAEIAGMNLKLTFLLLLGVLEIACPSFAEEGAPLSLGIGEQRAIKIQGLVRYSLSGEALRATRTPSPSGQHDWILVKGVREGSGDLWVWKQDGSSEHRSIQVEKWRDDGVSPRLKQAISRLQEVDVLISGQGYLLRGLIQSRGELARVFSLTQGFPGEVRNETEVSEALLEEGGRRLSQWLKSTSLQERVRIERYGDGLWLRGSISNPAEARAIEAKGRNLFPALQSDVSSLPDQAPTIHFRVFLLELKKSRFGTLGLSWPSEIAGAFQVTPSAITQAIRLEAAIQALEGEGSARVLSRPELVVRAPGEAELFAGGEIPIRTSTHYSSQVTWKTYGLSLKLKVTNVTGEQVRLDIQTEVSHLDAKVSGDSIPGLQANRMKTQVDARFSTPLLLSGLLQEDTREQARGLPFLRRLPILGSLFGSEDYLRVRSELVAVLLPSATPPPAPMERLEKTTPKGPIPPPRDWISPQKERALRESPNFPWNAME